MHRYLVTGTDSDVGKTRVAAALATALRTAGEDPTVVKLVQTGMELGVPGDAARAGKLACSRHVELARFCKDSDPWSAALADGTPTIHAEDLNDVIAAIPGAVVAEGDAGLAVPLNRNQNFSTVAVLAKLRIVLVVGLRPGCMNHALLTLALCDQLQLGVAGCVLVDRWGDSPAQYAADVAGSLQGKIHILGIVPFDADESASVEQSARLFAPLP